MIFGKAAIVSKKLLAAVTASEKGFAWLVFVRACQGLSASLCGIVVVRQNKQVGFMNRLNRVLAAAVILAVFAAGGIPAASSSIEDGHVPAERVQKQWYGDTVRALAAGEDADSLFAAALILPLTADPESAESFADARREAHELLDRALSGDSGSGELLAHALMNCFRISSCDPEQYAGSADRLAADNAMLLLPWLQAAVEAGDEDGTASLLERMAAADGYDSYLLETGERVARALKGVDLPEHDLPPAAFDGDTLNAETRRALRLNQTSYIVLSNGVPTGYRSLIDACSRDSLSSKLQESCRSIALKMQDSASMLDAMLGVALLNRAARDEQDRRQANEMKRRLSWLSSSYSRYEAGLAEDEDEALSEEQRYHRSLLNGARVLETLYEQGGEIKGMQALLTEAGLPVEPPEDWSGDL